MVVMIIMLLIACCVLGWVASFFVTFSWSPSPLVMHTSLEFTSIYVPIAAEKSSERWPAPSSSSAAATASKDRPSVLVSS